MMRALTLGLFALSATAASLLQQAGALAKPQPNPYAGDLPAILAGEKLFARECSACHGAAGNGNNRRGTPALRTPLVQQANPGTLFWILRNGSSSHRMPSFSHLPEQQRWQIIRYLQNR